MHFDMLHKHDSVKDDLTGTTTMLPGVLGHCETVAVGKGLGGSTRCHSAAPQLLQMWLNLLRLG